MPELTNISRGEMPSVDDTSPSALLRCAVLLTGFLMVMSSAGITYTYGEILVVLVNELNMSTTTSVAVSSVQQCVFSFTGR